MGRLGAVTACTAVMVTACVGSITENEFRETVNRRGGGIGSDLPTEAIDALQARWGGDTLELVSLSVTSGRVVLEVPLPGTTDELDRYSYGSSGLFGGKGLSGPEPVPVQPSDVPFADVVFTADDAGVDQIDGIVDEALAGAELPGVYATEVTVNRPPGQSDPVIVVTATDDRRTVVATFSSDGSLLGMEAP